MKASKRDSILRMQALAATWIVACAGVSASAADTLVVLPQAVTLSTREARQQLVLMRSEGEQLVGQLREGVEWQSSDEKIVKIVSGSAMPVANGKATISARAGEQSASVEVTVTGQDAPFTWSFRNHVESVISKVGCNGGACHGALAGKNGFKLTLAAYDPEADFLAIARQAQGRRLVLSDPGRSLLLTKPTGAIPHKGGVRLDAGTLEYRALAEWIAAGAPPPETTDARIERLEILPAYSRQTVGAKQQVVVRAHFSNGQVEDVTRWAKYTSVNETVANVDGVGLLSLVGPGEGGVKAWYLGQNALAFVSVPYANKVAPEVFAQAPRRNFIDEEVLAKLQSLNLPPSPPCDDATFLRRAMLDTLGVLPTPDEVRAFTADTAADKRDRLIEALLARPEFVDYWTHKWSDLLLVNGNRLRPQAVKSMSEWIRKRVTENTPWDEFVRKIVTASGSTFENGAANFYSLHQDPTEMAETTSQAFLGMSIGCAKCHNHPLEKWTNDQYFAFANMFARVRAKGWGGDVRAGDGNRTVFVVSEGDLIQPNRGKPQPPAPLDGTPLSFEATDDRREHLARWLTAPENPYFARAIVNRVWANYLGAGLVEKVDDVRLTNPASNERLLAAASKFLVENKYDLKALMRAIMQSHAYQRSSTALAENKADERFYSHFLPRRLKAEVILDAVSQATGAATEFKDIPKGTRALQLTDSSVASYFLDTFGRPDRLLTCECERSNEASMTQVFHLINGDSVNAKLAAKENRLEKLLAAKMPDEKLLEELYLSSLSRLPTETQRTETLATIRAAPEAERRAAWEDAFWAILSSKEFLFNH